MLTYSSITSRVVLAGNNGFFFAKKIIEEVRSANVRRSVIAVETLHARSFHEGAARRLVMRASNSLVFFI